MVRDLHGAEHYLQIRSTGASASLHDFIICEILAACLEGQEDY